MYARYADERSRPVLRACSPGWRADDPDYVVDAGCGSGELTVELARRWPSADRGGLRLLARHDHQGPRARTPPRFAVADVTTWRPDRPVDVIVSNAVLQWVPEHRDVLRALDGRAEPAEAGWPSRCRATSTPPATWRSASCAARPPGPTGSATTTGAAPVDDADRLPGPAGRRLPGGRLGDDVRPRAPRRARTRCSTGSPAPPCGPIFDRLAPDEAEEVHRRAGRAARGGLSGQAVRHALPVPADLRGGAEMIIGLHHVQLAAPAGSEPELRAFYGGRPRPPGGAQAAGAGQTWWRLVSWPGGGGASRHRGGLPARREGAPGVPGGRPRTSWWQAAWNRCPTTCSRDYRRVYVIGPGREQNRAIQTCEVRRR